MQRTIYKSVAVLLVMLYLPTVFVGTAGLHELLGCHHGESAPCSEDSHEASDASIILVRSAPGTASHHADRCPICQWFAQGQQFSVLGLPAGDLPLIHATTLPEAPTNLPRLSCHERLPRAPPLFA